MNIYLFSLDLNLVIILSLIFIFIVPFLLLLKIKKSFIITYLISYFIILFLGVFSEVKISNKSVSFSLLITNTWSNNKLVIANFYLPLVIINLVLLFPLGVLLPTLLKGKHIFYKVLFIGFIVSCFIEFMQFLLPIVRYPELLDVLNNSISVILGYLYYLFISKFISRRGKNDWISKQEND